MRWRRWPCPRCTVAGSGLPSLPIDKEGRRTQVIDSFGGTQTSLYDLENRLTRRSFQGHGQELRVDYTYDELSRIDTVTRYSDLAGLNLVASSDYDYDASGRITHIVHSDGVTAIDAFDYSYDDAGFLLSQSDDTGTINYTNDDAGQLLGDGVNTYDYDAAGNRVNADATPVVNNQVSNDANWTYSYDERGNLIEKDAISTDEEWTYQYNVRNQLVHVEHHDASSVLVMEADYKYDFFGNRIEKAVDADGVGSNPVEVTRYAYDGWNGAKGGAIGTENFDVWAKLNSSNGLTTEYLHGDEVDELLARIDSASSSAVPYWHLTDHQKSVRYVLDSSGNVVDALRYDGFGNITYELDDDYRGDYAWTTRELDVETGLQYNRARYYDGATGRWISMDPLGFDAGDSNLYRYVNNRPTINLDPSGLHELPSRAALLSGKRAAPSPAADAPFIEGIFIPEEALKSYAKKLSQVGATIKAKTQGINETYEAMKVLGPAGDRSRLAQKLQALQNERFAALVEFGELAAGKGRGTVFAAGILSDEAEAAREKAERPKFVPVKTGPENNHLDGGLRFTPAQREQANRAYELHQNLGRLQDSANQYGRMGGHLGDPKREAILKDEIQRTRGELQAMGYGESDFSPLHFVPVIGSAMSLAQDIEEGNILGAAMSAVFLAMDVIPLAGQAASAAGRAVRFVSSPAFREALLATRGVTQATGGGLVRRAGQLGFAEVTQGGRRGIAIALEATANGGRTAAQTAGRRISLEVLATSCFVAGTLLLTPDGEKPIESFRTGDAILARSEHHFDGPVQTKIVEQTFVREASIMRLRVRGRDIRTTGEHPFFVEGKGWICAREIRTGDRLSSHDGQWVTVEAVTDLNEVATVYNLRVSDYHTYFVGSREWGFSVWAHNANYEWFQMGGKYYARDSVTKRLVRNGSGEILELADRAAVTRWATGLEAGSTASEASGLISRLHTFEGAQLPGGIRIQSLTLVDEVAGLSGTPVLAGNSIIGNNVAIRIASNQSNRQAAISIYHEMIEVAIARYGPTGPLRGRPLPAILNVADDGIDALARGYYNSLGVPSVENLTTMLRAFGL